MFVAEIFNRIKESMHEEENEEEADVNMQIPPEILKDVLGDSCKRKADGSLDCCHCKV